MRKPNVIVFFTDQQRHDTTGLHGNPMGLTPNFDRYGREGTHLFHSFTCQPLCGPARSSMQTGRFATQTGCYRNHIPLPQDAETLATGPVTSASGTLVPAIRFQGRSEAVTRTGLPPTSWSLPRMPMTRASSTVTASGGSSPATGWMP